MLRVNSAFEFLKVLTCSVTAALSLTQALLIYGHVQGNKIRDQVKDSFYIQINADHLLKRHMY